MSDGFEQFAKLRTLYPEDIKRIEADEKALNQLRVMQEFAAQPVVQGLLDQCRKDILFASTALATNRQLEEVAPMEADLKRELSQ